MDPWPFVTSAYAVAVILTGSLLLWAFRSMRRSESAAEAIGQK